MITVYTYANCDTCRKATKWLRAHRIAFSEKPIRDTPPSKKELKRMLEFKGGEIRHLFNTSGKDYRAAGLKDLLPGLTTDAALERLAANGNLVKRPFLLGGNFGLVGFKEADWAEALLR